MIQPDAIDTWYGFFFGQGHWHGVLGWHVSLIITAITFALLGHHVGKK